MRIRGVKTWLSIVGALLLTMTLVLPQTVVAQAGGSRQIVNGQTVAWNAEWLFEPDVSFVDEGIELVAFSGGTSVVGYGGTNFPVPGNQLRDILLEGFTSEGTLTQIDRGDYDNVSYSIDISVSDGIPLALFTLVIEGATGTTMAVLIDGPGRFQAGMEAAQNGITIDGAPIFEGVDAAQMQQTISAAPAVNQPTGTTPAAPQPPTPTSAPPAQTPTPAGGLIRPPLGQNTPVAPPAQTPTPAPAAQLPNSHTIPSSGTEVRFSAAWSVSNSANDSVSLRAPAVPTVVNVLATTDDLPAMSEPRGFADALAQTPSFAGSTVVDAIAVDNGSRWLIVLTQPDPELGTVYMVYEVRSAPSGATVAGILVPQVNLPAALQLVAGSVHVNGQPVLADAVTQVPALQVPGT